MTHDRSHDTRSPRGKTGPSPCFVDSYISWLDDVIRTHNHEHVSHNALSIEHLLPKNSSSYFYW
jgi:hypothetical protein